MSKKGKEWIVWSILAVGLFAIIAGIYGVVAQSGRSVGDSNTLLVPVAADERVRGNKDAKVTIVEYSDFQCPACKYFYGMVRQLEEEKGNDVGIVFRHFPLEQHAHARIAALAAEAAGMQGKFWEMHDVLFEKQDEWSKSENIQQTLVGYATLIGLDINRFVADVQTKELSDKIDKDIAGGTKQNIEGTPTFYANGRLIKFRSYEELKQLVESEIK